MQFNTINEQATSKKNKVGRDITFSNGLFRWHGHMVIHLGVHRVNVYQTEAGIQKTYQCRTKGEGWSTAN